jgi:Na+/H+ antiporter NhaD/arsenite permease-like protein
MESLVPLVSSHSPVYGLLIFALALILSSIKPEYKALVFISSLAIIVNIYSLNLEKIFIERTEIIKIVSAVFGLEVLSALLSKGRFYELISHRILGRARSPNRIFIMMNLLTALLSAILSNVLVLLYMVLVAVKLAECIPEFDPRDLVTSLIISSNLGSMATFMGDISNIIVGVNGDISFLDFLSVAAPISMASTLLSLSVLFILLRRGGRFHCEVAERSEIRGENPYLIFGLTSLILMLTLIPFSRGLGIDDSLAIGIMAVFLLFLGGDEISKVFTEVDWPSLIYLGALLLTTESINLIGGFKILFEEMSLFRNQLNVYFVSIGLSMLIDDAEAVAILSPVLRSLNAGRDLWWAAIVGSSIGSALTPWGSIANIIALRKLRESYRGISILRFLKISILANLPTIILAYVMLNWVSE